MKERVLSIFLLSLFIVPSFPQEKVHGNSDSSPPILSYRDTVYDFGTIRSGTEAVHYFVFSNDGKSPLVISNVRTSCGCAVPEWPGDPVPGGGKDSLRVEYNTRIKGAFDKTIMVYSNATEGLTELRIRGNVVKTR